MFSTSYIAGNRAKRGVLALLDALLLACYSVFAYPPPFLWDAC
jgi:hypothetical protein